MEQSINNQELMFQAFKNIETLYEEFSSNHYDYVNKGNKSAGKRARIAIGEIKKIITDYRKLNLTFSKELKK